MIQHKMAVYEPMAQILREAVEVFENEQISREYDDVAPSTQYEETQHELLETTQSGSFEFFDPDRPPGRPPVGELKKVGKSRIFWQKVGKSRRIFHKSRKR